jgi:hypothetical protein
MLEHDILVVPRHPPKRLPRPASSTFLVTINDGTLGPQLIDNRCVL